MDRATDHDYLWGRERHPQSPAHGELVVPVIFIWNRPPLVTDIRRTDDGAIVLTRGGRHVIAVAEHNTQVQIKDEIEAADGRMYYLIEIPRNKSEWVGRFRRFLAWLRRRPVRGWVPLTMLLQKGDRWWQQDWAT